MQAPACERARLLVVARDTEALEQFLHVLFTRAGAMRKESDSAPAEAPDSIALQGGPSKKLAGGSITKLSGVDNGKAKEKKKSKTDDSSNIVATAVRSVMKWLEKKGVLSDIDDKVAVVSTSVVQFIALYGLMMGTLVRTRYPSKRPTVRHALSSAASTSLYSWPCSYHRCARARMKSPSTTCAPCRRISPT